MFRLISLNIDDQSYLGHIKEGKLFFLPESERTQTELPYTSVLIGPNGTGKSTLLKYIAEIFEDVEYYKNNFKRRKGAIIFPYSIKYMIDSVEFIIYQSRPKVETIIKKKEIHFKWEYKLFVNNVPIEDWSKIKTPSKVIAVSYLAMDRFRQKKNEKEDYYQYLGLRSQSNAASPSYFLNNTLPLLFDYIYENESVGFLKETLNFMKMDSTYLGVQLEYRYKKYFFVEDLSIIRFNELFENYKIFSERKSTPRAVDYYKKYIANDDKLINRIVKYIQIRTFEDNITFGENNVLKFNLFENPETLEELALIHHLQKLDLLASATLLFKKGASSPEVSAQNLSSGEFHFLTTMIAIQASIKQNALVLIDEPDTSLHPNWQMKYANHLKEIFKKWNSSHFILATHSHFIVSDLEGESSAVIGLTGQTPNVSIELFDYNTYGWSAEEILLKVFEVPTTRNYFVYEEVGEILEMIALPDRDNQKIIEKVNFLRSKGLDKLSKEDPLKEIIDKLIKKYANIN